MVLLVEGRLKGLLTQRPDVDLKNVLAVVMQDIGPLLINRKGVS